jgi:hypothetical protein
MRTVEQQIFYQHSDPAFVCYYNRAETNRHKKMNLQFIMHVDILFNYLARRLWEDYGFGDVMQCSVVDKYHHFE